MKSVIIAFANPLLTSWATTVLSRGGYTIEYSFRTAGDIARVADFCTSPVVVCGFQFADMTAEGLMSVLGGRLAMVAVVLPHQRNLVDRLDIPVVPYPVSALELVQAVEEAERTAARAALGISSAGTSVSRPEERPAEEKLLILKAKGILMQRFRMTESQAHRCIQKTSMDRSLKLIDTARMIIDGTL